MIDLYAAIILRLCWTSLPEMMALLQRPDEQPLSGFLSSWSPRILIIPVIEKILAGFVKVVLFKVLAPVVTNLNFSYARGN
jgi:hypothetical protein